MRLALIHDFRAERWPSMDLCADQLFTHLPAISGFTLTELTPAFCRLAQRIPAVGRANAAFNADRLFNRHLLLPRHLQRHAAGFDCFHVVDHSYAHVVTALPPGKAGVYCHDLDAFRSVLDPAKEQRPWWFRRLAARTLHGLKTAAVVFHSTSAVGRQLAQAGLVPQSKLVHAPYGVAVEFTPIAPPDPIPLPSPGLPHSPFLLHVGSHIPRKRIDVLLNVFALVRKRIPDLKLVQVGPPFSRVYIEQIERLGIGADVLQFTGLSREQLAELYRRAAAVLVPSEAEGFGLPVIEAMACGAAVVASGIPVLREVGGDAALFCPVAEMYSWAETIVKTLAFPGFAPSRELRLARTGRYTWQEHARIIGEAYRELIREGKSP